MYSRKDPRVSAHRPQDRIPWIRCEPKSRCHDEPRKRYMRGCDAAAQIGRHSSTTALARFRQIRSRDQVLCTEPATTISNRSADCSLPIDFIRAPPSSVDYGAVPGAMLFARQDVCRSVSMAVPFPSRHDHGWRAIPNDVHRDRHMLMKPVIPRISASRPQES